ncbi:MAG: AI-2E family transporter [Deltaproteobacteria bacterium]|nr:AI-2E family transporter [Deltaproteobacteria bacterium]MBW2518348.1 AI-2E family transporter [Deltaproteobacteria bacterium]
MNTSSQPSNDKLFVTRALEATIHIGLAVLLLYWCFKIGQPFIQITVWGIIIAVAIHPGYTRLKSALGGRGRLAAALVTLFSLIVLLVPAFMLSGSLIKTAQDYSAQLAAGTLNIPPPSESVRSWPVIGEPLYEFWSLAWNNLGAAFSKITPQLKKLGIPLLSAAAGAGVAILKFVLSIIIAGVLLANDAGGARAARAIAERLLSERGAEAVKLAIATVRSVTLGILGVALVQALLASLGFIFVGVPGAGFWALLVLILAVVQLPTILVIGPIIIYVFSTSSTGIAFVFAIWSILVGISDTFLKPFLMGRGVDVPMLVIFIGAIGGFMTSGIIGLFVGAIIFSLGYKLFLLWLNMEIQSEGESLKPE